MAFLLALQKNLQKKIEDDEAKKKEDEEKLNFNKESYQFYERERQKLFQEAEEQRRLELHLELQREELRQQAIKDYEAERETPPEGSVLVNCRFWCKYTRQQMSHTYKYKCEIDYTIEGKPRKWLTTFSKSVVYTVTDECLINTVLEHISRKTYDTSKCKIYRR